MLLPVKISRTISLWSAIKVNSCGTALWQAVLDAKCRFVDIAVVNVPVRIFQRAYKFLHNFCTEECILGNNKSSGKSVGRGMQSNTKHGASSYVIAIF
jgi:hypothetical protein